MRRMLQVLLFGGILPFAAVIACSSSSSDGGADASSGPVDSAADVDGGKCAAAHPFPPDFHCDAGWVFDPCAEWCVPDDAGRD